MNMSNRRLQPPIGLDAVRGALDYVDSIGENGRRYLANKPYNDTGIRLGDTDTIRYLVDATLIPALLGLPPGARILDVACGPGWMSEVLARFGYLVTGVDISPAMIEIAQTRAERLPEEVRARLTYRVHNIVVGALEEQFDAVIVYDALHHFEQERVVVDHLASMLNSNGRLFIAEGSMCEDPEARAELDHEMLTRGVLESPFDPAYLREILSDAGFVILGDYMPSLGMIDRRCVGADGRARVAQDGFNYLLLARVESGVGLSTENNGLKVSWAGDNPGEVSVQPRALIELRLCATNVGEAVWLCSTDAARGDVRVGVRVRDTRGNLIFERHGQPAIDRSVLPGETVNLAVSVVAPDPPGTYQVAIDLLAEGVAWFADEGSSPVTFLLHVASSSAGSARI